MSSYHRTPIVSLDDDNRRLRREQEQLRAGNSALRSQLQSAENFTNSLRKTLDTNIRDLHRQSAALSAQNEQIREFSQRIHERQHSFEKRTESQIEDLNASINRTEGRLNRRIDAVEDYTRRAISETRNEIRETERYLSEQIETVNARLSESHRLLSNEISNTRAELEEQVDDLRRDIDQKERNRAAEAIEILDWVEARLKGLQHPADLGLEIEFTRIRHMVERGREQLSGSDGGMAVATAQSALAAYETVFVETERRLGIIEGNCEHLESVVEAIESEMNLEGFSQIFPNETSLLCFVAAEIRKTVEVWRRRKHWIVFENDRERTLERAHRALAYAVELRAALPNLMEQLKEREILLKDAAAVATEVFGLVDRFEVVYANPADPKSPRVLKAHVGRQRLETHLDLSGEYSFETYGFESADSCADVARKMKNSLEQRFPVIESQLDPANPQRAWPAGPEVATSWREISSRLEALTVNLGKEK